MFYPSSKLRGALLRAQLECARYLAAGSVPDVLVAEVLEIHEVIVGIEGGVAS